MWWNIPGCVWILWKKNLKWKLVNRLSWKYCLCTSYYRVFFSISLSASFLFHFSLLLLSLSLSPHLSFSLSFFSLYLTFSSFISRDSEKKNVTNKFIKAGEHFFSVSFHPPPPPHPHPSPSPSSKYLILRNLKVIFSSWINSWFSEVTVFSLFPLKVEISGKVVSHQMITLWQGVSGNDKHRMFLRWNGILIG